MRSRLITAVVLIVLTLKMFPQEGWGDVTLPAVIGDHMVLQLGREIPFWGWGEPGEEVTVTITSKDAAAETVSTATGTDGRWFAKLTGRMKPGVVEIKIAGKNSIQLSDVLIGEVWLCSGQSNMEWPVKASLNHQEEIDEAKIPSIRIFKVERSTARVPQTDVEGHWIVCSPETVGDFSAVGYFFARDLHQRLKRPIGIIQASHGGAICEAWTSLAVLKSDPDFSQILERAEKANGDPNQANNPNRASVVFNGMIAPLQGFPMNKGLSIKGAIWYQGESNANRAYQYRKLFPSMIADWRRGWGIGDFPFLYVQLANYIPEKSKPEHPDVPEESAWAELREAQAMALSVPKTGMVVTTDIGDPRDIHPKNKQEVGRRLALSALKVAYGQDIVSSGPKFKSMKVIGQEVELEFQSDDGLAANREALDGFAVATADRKFVWARARIEGDKVLVSEPSVREPVAVRYAWGDNPKGNLVNRSGLPASPFRTDDWPGVTVLNR
jgi:sialate O-acetylesterase